ncbi:MAG: hypothetical protein EOP33_04915 [Rickettsiaceae bacterium]|nr:MAG: hypothetical protein EOP33_04915 [Rickettsiaceae bacterium]
MSKSQYSQAIVNPEAYNQRDVRGLAPVSKWTSADEQLQKEHNRLLQPGFLTREASEIIADARLLREDWLTDICCPTINSALVLNISKELVVNYRVGETDLNAISHDIFKKIQNTNPNIIKNLDDRLSISVIENLDDKALEYLAKKNTNLAAKGEIAIPINEHTLSATKRILIDTQNKQLTHQFAGELVQKELKILAPEMKLEPKPIFDQNKDYSFLGAAGSGKSTISQQFIADNDKDKFIILATDVYRAFNMPGTENHENKATKDIFTRTQDTAYLVKELVLQDLQKKFDSQRPNIIFDAVSLEPEVKKILAQGELTSLVAAYGPVGYEGIVERADARARNPNAAPADLGRYVNTTSLLEGHSNASERLLSSIPPNVSTLIYNTDIEKGKNAIVIGKIDAKNMTMDIDDLKVMAEFLNKKNINIEAVNQVDLIYNTKNPLNTLSTHPENKAQAIIELVPKGKYKEPYTVTIKHQDQPYLTLTSNELGRVQMKILDKNVYNSKAMADTVEGSILRAVTRQIEYGSLEASLSAALSKGEKKAFLDTKTVSIVANTVQSETKTQSTTRQQLHFSSNQTKPYTVTQRSKGQKENTMLSQNVPDTKNPASDINIHAADKSAFDKAIQAIKNSQVPYQTSKPEKSSSSSKDKIQKSRTQPSRT